jgi:hypothetical protein
MTSARFARWISGCVNAGASVEIFLGVEPDADAVLHATGAALALIGAALRDGLDGQTLRARARIVTADAREAGVNHVTNAGNRQRGFGDVGGDDDLPADDGAKTRCCSPAEAAEEWDDSASR